MNRREARARSWVHWAALCAALVAILAVWGLWPSEPPWLIITGLCAAFLALLVVESRHRREPIPRGPVEDLGPPSGDTVAEFLAAVDARYGTGGLSGAATPHRVLWNGEALPPMLPPVMATAPYPDHDHSGRLGPCPACVYTLGVLGRLAGAQDAAGERLAAPGLAQYAGRLMADTDAQARAIMADHAAQVEDARGELAAPLGGPACPAELGPHLCGKRGQHARHRCECGTVWGQI